MRGWLAAFDGEWDGEIVINAPDGYRLRKTSAQRRVWWDGANQYSEISFIENGETYLIRARRWIALGRLYCEITRPAQQSVRYTGEASAQAITWLNTEQSGLSISETLALNQGIKTIELRGLEPVRLRGLPPLVQMQATFRPRGVREPTAEPIATEFRPGAARLLSASVETMASVDGKPARGVPAEFTDLEPGVHVARFSRPGYRSATVEFFVRSGETAVVEQKFLERESGAVAIDSNPPGADYTLSAEPRSFGTSETIVSRGTTPATIDTLPPGNYTVTLRLDGSPDHTTELVVRDSATATVNHRFRRGEVWVESVPSGAAVTLGDTLLGRTPLKLDAVRAGEFAVRVALEGYEPADVRGTVTLEKPLELAARLKPLPNAPASARPAPEVARKTPPPSPTIPPATRPVEPPPVPVTPPAPPPPRPVVRAIEPPVLPTINVPAVPIVVPAAPRPVEPPPVAAVVVPPPAPPPTPTPAAAAPTPPPAVPVPTPTLALPIPAPTAPVPAVAVVETPAPREATTSPGRPDVIVPPLATKKVAPQIDRDRFISEHTVSISVEIDAAGVPRDFRFIKGKESPFAGTCADALAQWRFRPATVNGKPAIVRVTVPFVIR